MTAEIWQSVWIPRTIALGQLWNKQDTSAAVLALHMPGCINNLSWTVTAPKDAIGVVHASCGVFACLHAKKGMR